MRIVQSIGRPRTPSLGLILGVFAISIGNFSAAEDSAEFARFPAEKKITECRELDFNSYFRAQNFQRHLKKDNPDRSKPNFGGKYLLLKQEMMMETLWLIADCETGKFINETLTGVAGFRPDSLLVIVSRPKSDEKPSYQVWRNDQWARVEPLAEATPAGSPGAKPVGSPNGIASTPSPAAGATTLAAEDKIFETLYVKHAVPRIGTCRDLDFNSYFRAQSSKGNLIRLNPERSKPNFSGKYLLLKNDVLFERFWLIADCSTGKFVSEIIKGNVEFRPDSAMLVVRNSGDYARLSLWRDERFVGLINPARTTAQEIENRIYDQDALDLMAAAGAGKYELKVEFEELKCIEQNCTIQIFPDPKPKALTAKQAMPAMRVLNRWGDERMEGGAISYSIQWARCVRKERSPYCDIKLKR